MKRLASILLIITLFYNLGGYRIILPLLQDRADQKLESLLDNNDYEESDLVEVRVELNVPYQQRYTEFERHYGQVEIDGKSYTFVKSKIEGNVVIFKCIANESREHLKNIENDLAKANSATNTPGPSNQSQLIIKNVLSDFDDSNQFYQPASVIASNTSFHANYDLHLPQVAFNTPHQPPEC